MRHCTVSSGHKVVKSIVGSEDEELWYECPEYHKYSIRGRYRCREQAGVDLTSISDKFGCSDNIGRGVSRFCPTSSCGLDHREAQFPSSRAESMRMTASHHVPQNADPQPPVCYRILHLRTT